MTDALLPTPRTRLTRLPARGRYDRETIDAILDEAFVCHLAFRVGDQSYAIPTGYARSGDQIVIHGSAASRMIRTLEGGVDLCATVTLVDGLVLARSAFHHSINYRSVVILGRARSVSDPAEKLQALRALTNHIVPGRWEEVRTPTAQELKATTVLAMALDEASAKIRTGPPSDDAEDIGLHVWAGVVPLTTIPGEPIAADSLPQGVPLFDRDRLLTRPRSHEAFATKATSSS